MSYDLLHQSKKYKLVIIEILEQITKKSKMTSITSIY
jgi:hypothetical protein